MPFMIWNDRLSVGVETLDGEHKILLGLINELYDGILAGQGKQVLSGVLDRLVEYTQFHFRHEEALFDGAGYLEAENHKRQHDVLAEQVIEVQARFKEGNLPAPSLEVMNFLKDWLYDHVLESDQKYTEHLNAMGIR